jgi:hypothetical protein
MRFMPYVIIAIAAALGGYGMGLRPAAPILFVLAFASAVSVFMPRRQALREQPQAPDQNMILDGVFLFFSQLLIVFVAYALGVLIGRLV